MAKDKGFEYLDDTPVEVPVRLRRKDSWAEMVQHVAHELSRRQAEQGEETLEDMLDFDEDPDDDISQSEMRYMKEEELLTQALEAARVRTERYRNAQLHKELTRGRKRGEGEGEGERSAPDKGGNAVRDAGFVDVVQKPEKKG